ncbi:ABC transporter permease [Homoserinibacter sp. YIM 151385]|uniref:ABC transporter permease n=1 Tax=Homoserinibacter sp. YIM 151385 TaxID=2985506 RepID=UPI0022F09727|nr:ABC transporter permease [Homoserinibacter sp. YIM 151385]WBU38254.1 ABC transporter permease [Homoserinibacter sp. YIM 151385]
MNAVIDRPTTVRREDAAGTGARLWRVAKLTLANPTTVLITPLAILVAILLGYLALWWVVAQSVPAATEGFRYSGATLFIFVYMMVVAVQAMNSTFGFALGMGATRRDYFLGSSLAFLILALVFTTIITVLGAVEEATGGWGLGARMFTDFYFSDGPWWERAFITFAYFAFFLFVGTAIAVIYVRWKARGLTVFFLALTAALIAAVALVILTDSWSAIGGWFAAQGFVGAVAWTLPVTAVSGLVGFLLLRRATPRG